MVNRLYKLIERKNGTGQKKEYCTEKNEFKTACVDTLVAKACHHDHHAAHQYTDHYRKLHDAQVRAQKKVKGNGHYGTKRNRDPRSFFIQFRGRLKIKVKGLRVKNSAKQDSD